ncbi:hypothetical protein IFT43_20460 [Oxalobacteraceae sp. CFBP 13708]|nr:hypothetical protein [Oxalobacteraceae sp. CFBP 13708]
MSENKHANLRLAAKLLPLIVPFMAKDDIRYYLNGINVRPHKGGGAIIVATNGHTLGAIRDPRATCEHEVILRFDTRMQQACAAGLSDDREIVMIGERLAVVDNAGREVYIQAGEPEIEGNFPRYERVIPKLETLQPGLIGTYSATVLAPVEKAAMTIAKRSKSSYSGLQFFNVGGDPNLCAVVRLPVEPEFVAVLMPMRDDVLKAATPEWVSELHAAVDTVANQSRSAA